MPDQTPWLRRVVEKITGQTFATRDDIHIIECHPLLVLDEQWEVVYSGEATIEFKPYWGGVGSLRVISPTGRFPNISAETYRQVRSGDWARVPVGVAFAGMDNTESHYHWLIDRAAVNFMKRKVHEAWVPGALPDVEEEVDPSEPDEPESHPTDSREP